MSATGSLYNFEAAAVTWLVGVYGVLTLAAVLRRSRPGMAVSKATFVAFNLRVLVAIGVQLTSFGASLRGGDEHTFLQNSHALAALPFSASAWGTNLTQHVYQAVFAAQYKLFDSPDIALRIFDSTIATAGIVLLVAATYDLGGPRAAVIAAWLLAFEPATVLFASALHKEPFMFLASGLVAFGGARLWRRGTLSSLLPMVLGCLIAIATRPYAGYFLIGAGAATVLHASVRIGSRHAVRGITLLAMVVLLATITAPIIVYASSKKQLAALQASQVANSSNVGANLSLERVDYSTRSAILSNLPRRLYDLIVRPYPWQVGNSNQQLGILGSIVVLITAYLFATYAWRNRGHVMGAIGPIIYTAAFLLIAYSLSAGNAGTGFRYRSNAVPFVICAAIILRERLAVRRAVVARSLVPTRSLLASPSRGGVA